MASNATNQGASFIPLIDQIKAMQAKQAAMSPMAAVMPELGTMSAEKKMDLFNIVKVPAPEMVPGESGQIPGMGALQGRK
jgi:hypothetical protein